MVALLFISFVLPVCLSQDGVMSTNPLGNTTTQLSSLSHVANATTTPNGPTVGNTSVSPTTQPSPSSTITTGHAKNRSSNNALSCYDKSSQQVSSCDGACIAKMYIRLGVEKGLQVGCQHVEKTRARAGKNKCSYSHDHTPRFLSYTVRIQDPKKWDRTWKVSKGDEIKVFKKCCFTDRCNHPRTFEQEITGLLETRHKAEKPTRGDTAIISVIVLSVIALLIVYSVWKAWRSFEKEKDKSPDYEQKLDAALLAAGSEEGTETGKEVRGELSLRETAAVLMVMMFPPKQESQSTSSTDNCVVILPPRAMQAAGHGHGLVKTLRTRPFFLQSILFRMLEHGPYFFPFRPMELLELFDEAMDVFQAQKSLVFVSSCVIIGDLRGSYSDLCRWLQAVGWPPKTRLLFLGNVLDVDEPGSLETIALIAALKIAFPSEVFLLRGQTETFHFNPDGRFPARTNNAIGRCIMRMCSFLPTAAIVQERILAVPSGITPLIGETKDLIDLPRPATLETLSDTQRHLLFNQPSSAVRMYRKNKNSHGNYFGHAAVERIRSDLSVNMIVRGGAPVPEGYCPCWDHSLVSLWSTASKGSEKGAVLLVSNVLEVTPVKMLRQTAPDSTSAIETSRRSTSKGTTPRRSTRSTNGSKSN